MLPQVLLGGQKASAFPRSRAPCIPGDIGPAATCDFPVRLKRVMRAARRKAELPLGLSLPNIRPRFPFPDNPDGQLGCYGIRNDPTRFWCFPAAHT